MKKLFMCLFIVLAFFAKYDVSINVSVSKEREQSRAEMLEASKAFVSTHNPIAWISNYLAFNDCVEWDEEEACKIAEKAGYEVH